MLRQPVSRFCGSRSGVRRFENRKVGMRPAGEYASRAGKEKKCPVAKGAEGRKQWLTTQRVSDKSTNNNSPKQWYALWVYRSLVEPVKRLCKEFDAETYEPVRVREYPTDTGTEFRPEKILPNLLFARTTAEAVSEIRRLSINRAIPYCYPGTREPAPIDDVTMEMFMLVVKRGAERAETVDLPIDKGDRVRVTEGIFKGAEGYVRRVHGSKRFVVVISGVVAVAVTHVPRRFLERVDD